MTKKAVSNADLERRKMFRLLRQNKPRFEKLMPMLDLGKECQIVFRTSVSSRKNMVSIRVQTTEQSGKPLLFAVDNASRGMRTITRLRGNFSIAIGQEAINQARKEAVARKEGQLPVIMVRIPRNRTPEQVVDFFADKLRDAYLLRRSIITINAVVSIIMQFSNSVLNKIDKLPYYARWSGNRLYMNMGDRIHSARITCRFSDGKYTFHCPGLKQAAQGFANAAVQRIVGTEGQK